MKKGHCINKTPWWIIIEHILSGKTFEDMMKEYESEGEEDYDDIQFIDLVYPPGSNPPARNSIKKMNLFGFNHISLE